MINYGSTLEVELGGKLRTFKVTMYQFEQLSQLFVEEPEWIANPIRKEVETLFICFNHKGNDLPKDFDREMFCDWLTDLDDEKREELVSFADEAMGFLIGQLAKRMEQLTNKIEGITQEIRQISEQS